MQIKYLFTIYKSFLIYGMFLCKLMSLLGNTATQNLKMQENIYKQCNKIHKEKHNMYICRDFSRH